MANASVQESHEHLRSKLRQIFDTTETFSARLFDAIIQLLILYSLVCFSMETVPGLNRDVLAFLEISEAVVVVIFTLEYLLRIYASKKPFRFIFSFFGIIDLLAILPYYLAIGLDLRAVRLFRVLRIIRFFKLPRYSRAINRIKIAFRRP